MDDFIKVGDLRKKTLPRDRRAWQSVDKHNKTKPQEKRGEVEIG